jgi:hypothetical protein
LVAGIVDVVGAPGWFASGEDYRMRVSPARLGDAWVTRADGGRVELILAPRDLLTGGSGGPGTAWEPYEWELVVEWRTGSRTSEQEVREWAGRAVFDRLRRLGRPLLLCDDEGSIALADYHPGRQVAVRRFPPATSTEPFGRDAWFEPRLHGNPVVPPDYQWPHLPGADIALPAGVSSAALVLRIARLVGVVALATPGAGSEEMVPAGPAGLVLDGAADAVRLGSTAVTALRRAARRGGDALGLDDDTDGGGVDPIGWVCDVAGLSASELSATATWRMVRYGPWWLRLDAVSPPDPGVLVVVAGRAAGLPVAEQLPVSTQALGETLRGALGLGNLGGPTR